MGGGGTWSDHNASYLSGVQTLPEATLVRTNLPHVVFGEAVMILEFLNTFGPLFDLKEVIRGGITFGK